MPNPPLNPPRPPSPPLLPFQCLRLTAKLLLRCQEDLRLEIFGPPSAGTIDPRRRGVPAQPPSPSPPPLSNTSLPPPPPPGPGLWSQGGPSIARRFIFTKETLTCAYWWWNPRKTSGGRSGLSNTARRNLSVRRPWPLGCRPQSSNNWSET